MSADGSHGNTPVSFRISPPKTAGFLLWIAGAVTVICLLTQFVDLRTGHGRLLGLTPFFDLDAEQSFPTWFSSFLLLLASLLAAAIAARPTQEVRRFTGRWRFLAFLFLVMSVDEVAGAHEIIGSLVRENLHTGGYLYFSFVLPGAFLALGVATAYGRMLNALPRRTAVGMVLSGIIYVLAAVGLESVGGNWAYTHGRANGIYLLFSSAEEFLEMAGVILMFRTLAAYLESLLPDKTLTIEF